jgi:hypothetical protein
MTPEEAYKETLRRIRQVKDSGALELDLSGWKEGDAGTLEKTEFATLNRLPPELARLTSLQTLNLGGCKQLTDLSQLASLSSLQSLNIFGCDQLTDLSRFKNSTSPGSGSSATFPRWRASFHSNRSTSKDAGS